MTFRLVVGLSVLLCGCSPTPSDRDAAAVAPTATPAKALPEFGAAEISPASGSGREATFRVTVKPGPQKPLLIGLLINDRLNGEAACYVFRNLNSKETLLVADSGAGSTPLGQSTSVTNRQCELLRDGTDSSEDGSGSTATFHLRFRPAFRGDKHMWVAPSDAAGKGPELKQVGGWIVP
jgi:hypothetical protein